MEGQLWRILYDLMVPLGKFRSGKPGQIHSDCQVALVLLWAALHDRPMNWTCQINNWHGQCPWLSLPSNSTMSRRAKTIGVWLILCQVFDTLNSLRPPNIFQRIDARPLTVGGASKDQDARRGYGAGQLVKGYKLHELRSSSGHIDGWALSAMADKEPVVAPRLIAQIQDDGGYVTGDNGYDTNALYEQCGRQGLQLLAPPRPSAKGLGHRPHSRFRIRGLSMLENPLAVCGIQESYGQRLLKSRGAIERDFGHEVSLGCGFSSLPPWIRTPHRVGPWVQCKLIICTAWQVRDRLKKRDLCAA